MSKEKILMVWRFIKRVFNFVGDVYSMYVQINHANGFYQAYVARKQLSMMLKPIIIVFVWMQWAKHRGMWDDIVSEITASTDC